MDNKVTITILSSLLSNNYENREYLYTDLLKLYTKKKKFNDVNNIIFGIYIFIVILILIILSVYYCMNAPRHKYERIIKTSI
ncbi:hypothetical protein [Alphaentomopoxvirus acuprea]|uniref:Uncharacterized protein n=1 Tax=Alphaentomopoxvirus acuprea TaxID=62099 RepID=W6JJ19_9POXV|nr:hypothetical protein BA82_gp217 [Anomala cuprea entomopoxvirus]BAO49577.1 hypothetical protein [Anomala cuprea entomopoxvirus]